MRQPSVIAASFQAALLGFGGSGCDTSPTAPSPAVAGEGGCLFFNPFSSNFEARPGDARFNAPDLRRFIIGDYFGDGESTLTTLEANIAGFLPGYRAGYAFGAQYRDQTLQFAYDSIARQDGFAFLIGNANFAAEDDVLAAYGEIWLPLSPRLEATGALRYEDYGDRVGQTLDPKLTLLFRATDTLALRASFSTSFRAPSPFQTQGVQTNFTNIVDHDGARTSAGTISIVNVAFINADRIETTGLDLSARADFATDRGMVSAWTEATWLIAYDVTDAGVAIDALGKLNRANVGAPNQQLRFAAGLGWTLDAIRLNAMVRHVGPYEDDGGGDIDSFSTLGANARFSLGALFREGSQTSITLGAANLLDADPPYVDIAGSYDPRSADPRGRRVFLSASFKL